MMRPIVSYIIALILMPILAFADTDTADQDTQEDKKFSAAVDAVEKREYTTAFALFNDLAKANVADAQYNLAVLYNTGLGRPVNFREAAYWATRAQLNGISKAEKLAQNAMGLLPVEEQSKIVTRLREKISQEVDLADKLAAKRMARIYSDVMPEPDYENAYVWFSICNALGVSGCGASLKDIAGELTAEQILAVQKRAAEAFEQSAYVLGAQAAATN